MKLDEVDVIVTRLGRDFPDVDAYAVLQMVTAAEAVVVATTEHEAARRVEALCRAGLRLDWNPNQFQQVVHTLERAWDEPEGGS